MSHTFAFATVLLASSLSTAAALAATTVQSIHVGARSGVYLGDQFVDQQESLYPDPASIIGSTIGLRASASTWLTLGDADAGSYALSTGIWESADKGSIFLSWGWNAASSGVDTTLTSDGFDLLVANGEGRVEWEIVYAPIPEPGTWALMLAGSAAMGGVARRQRAADRG